MIELMIFFYFLIGLFINVGYYEKNKIEFKGLTDNEKTLNFLITWVFWIPIYLWIALRAFVSYITK